MEYGRVGSALTNYATGAGFHRSRLRLSTPTQLLEEKVMRHHIPASRRPRRAAGCCRAATGRGLLGVVAVMAGLTGVSAAPAVAATTPADVSANYAFHTVNNNRDTTFNQLLGINNSGKIAGYFGSGDKGHPNMGYTVSPGYGQGKFQNENFPGAAQTQVTGIDENGDTVGFWVDGQGANNGFYELHGGKPHTVNFPTTNNAKPGVDQLLGINTSGLTVGFYTDAKGTNHGFSYNIAKHHFKQINVAGDSNVTTATVNNLGDVAGFATNAAGNTEAFLLRSDGKLYRLNFPGATGGTQAFGVNDGDEVVGDYTMGTGNNATTDGFVWAPGFGFQTVDDPNGVGATTINGVNDRGTLVGFYTDSAGNTDGLLAKSALGA
jgi:hypothetical protein